MMLLDKEFLEVAAENGKLRARIAELKAALKPFADLAQYYDGCAGEYLFYARIKPNDLRAARAAYLGAKE